jgi:hypothetical protein
LLLTACSMLLLPFMSDAPDAEAAPGRKAVAAAMADPLIVTLRKSLLVLIGISSLSVWVIPSPSGSRFL